MVNLSAKFDSLTLQISKLLDLFEISAKALAKKEATSPEDPNTKRIIEKLDNISQQSGLIGRGLELIHKIGTENQTSPTPPRAQPRFPMQQRPPMRPPGRQMGMQPSIMSPSTPQRPSFQQPGPDKKMTKEISGGYEKSISTSEPEQKENVR
jgi:hypothetical protein